MVEEEDNKRADRSQKDAYGILIVASPISFPYCFAEHSINLVDWLVLCRRRGTYLVHRSLPVRLNHPPSLR
jgi:hypothetical protein